MKIIVSTKTFAREISRAIENKTARFDVIGEKSEIVFTGNRTIYAGMATTKEHSKNTYSGAFNPYVWVKVVSFLTQLPEQPIVINFTEYMFTDVHENPEIKLEQFVMTF